MRPELPTGTVTFLFTDIEGSTRLLREFGDGWAEALAEHHRVLREVWRQHSGVEVDTQGDAFFVAFARASDAVAAAAEGQRALSGGPIRVRIGLHTGEPLVGGDGYVGYDVHRAARIAGAGHGGQVLLSQTTVDLAGVDVRDLGLHRLKDLSAPERLFQLGTEEFPPLKTLHETNLPVPATPFLGRAQEIDETAGLLRRPDVRLVTLTGPGGSGKTRLADLFIQRAMAVRSDFSANGEIAEICRRLDCLPLAVELAAARVKVLSAESLLERLDQRLPFLAGGSRSAPDRQRTLRATIAWSHDLLSPEEQDLFARLAVFAGGCTLEAAEEVCGADIDAIASLVDKSLLRSTGDRFWMLETIRQFAAEQLDELPDAEAVRGKHAAWCTVLGERARPRLRTGEGRAWIDRLEVEHANLRAALDYLASAGRVDEALKLAASIWHYWAIRGHWTEGRRVFETLLAANVDGDPRDVVEALWGVAIFATWQGENDVTEACAVRILELADQHGLQRGEAVGTHVLAISFEGRGELDRARQLFEESLELARAGDDVWFLSVATNNLGAFHSEHGEYVRAAELFEESLAIGESLGDLERRGRQLNNLGAMRSRLGDADGALELMRRGLVAATEVGVLSVQRQSLAGIALCEAEAGNATVAARLFGQSEALRSRLGSAEFGHDERERTLAASREVLGDDGLASELAAGAAMPLDEAIQLALGQASTAPD